jgi:2'-hydroxyisoflavone reductase
MAAWIIGGVERRLDGIYNATGPAQKLTLSHMLEACQQGAGSQSEPVWVEPGFLLEHEVEPWTDLPLWVADKTMQGMLAADCGMAISAGLKYRPLVETAADLARWDQKRGLPALKTGLSPEREAALIKLWQEQAA